jgi:hypothetical protein
MRGLLLPIAVAIALAAVMALAATRLLQSDSDIMAGDWQIEAAGARELRFRPPLPGCLAYGEFCVTPNPYTYRRARGEETGP